MPALKVIYFSRDYTTHDRRFLSALAENEHQVYFLRLEQRGHSLEERPLPGNVQTITWAGGQKPYDALQFPRMLRGLRKSAG